VWEEQSELVKLISLFLLVGMLVVSGIAEDAKREPYSPELVKKAEAGDAKAQCDLGICYNKGEGVDKDEKEAVRWYSKAAEQGNARAQFYLGACYDNGTGVERDEKAAFELWTKSADQGDVEAKKALERIKTKQ
jgi:TPR repeat protein